jgi:hypothetical protein
MRQLTDSERSGTRAHAQPGSPDYKTKVAEPVMAAIDGLPKAYRTLIHELDYVDVYRTWRAGASPQQIMAFAARRRLRLRGLHAAQGG